MCKYELPTSVLLKVIVWQAHADILTPPKLYTTPLRRWSKVFFWLMMEAPSGGWDWCPLDVFCTQAHYNRPSGDSRRRNHGVLTVTVPLYALDRAACVQVLLVFGYTFITAVVSSDHRVTAAADHRRAVGPSWSRLAARAVARWLLLYQT